MATRDIAEIIVDRILDDLRSRPSLSGPWREQNDEIREHVRRIWANRVRKILGAVGHPLPRGGVRDDFPDGAGLRSTPMRDAARGGVVIGDACRGLANAIADRENEYARVIDDRV